MSPCLRAILCLIVLVLSNCQHTPTVDPGIIGPDVDQQPTLGSREDLKQKKIALVLGGVGVASFATVGVLKALEAENISPSFIVATGWPAIFSLGFGYQKSLHDVEWLAERLRPELFVKTGMLGNHKGFIATSSLMQFLATYFKQNDLRQTRIPIYLVSQYVDAPDPTATSEGPWPDALCGAVAAPGFHRPCRSRGAMISQEGLDVAIAKNLGAEVIIAVEMYGDYLQFASSSDLGTSEDVLRKYFSNVFRKSIRDGLKNATVRIPIRLSKNPAAFSDRRIAMRAGYDLTRKALTEYFRPVE